MQNLRELWSALLKLDMGEGEALDVEWGWDWIGWKESSDPEGKYKEIR
jgi:hypothetical protein